MTCIEAINTRKGKWRGIEFDYSTGSIAGGRRVAVHEYPYREDHYTEDLGRKARRWNISGYITQPDLRDKLRRLRNALEAPGPGPYYDAYANTTSICRVEEYTIDLSREDLTTATFSATFVEKGAEPAPTAIRRVLAGLFGAVERFNDLLGSGFNLIYGTIDDGQAVLDGFVGAAGYFDFQLRRSGGSGQSDLLQSPAAGMAPVFEATNAANPARETDFLRAMTGIDIGGSVAGRVNALAFAGAALSRYAVLTISRDYTDDLNARREVLDFVASARRVQSIAEGLGLYQLSAAAQELAAMAGGRVTSDLRDLPVIREYQASGHPFVLSRALFGSIRKAEDIMRWNGAVHGASIEGPVQYARGLE